MLCENFLGASVSLVLLVTDILRKSTVMVINKNIFSNTSESLVFIAGTKL